MRGEWLYRRDESPARRVALAPLQAASWLYGAGALLHREAYARGWRRRRKLACRVLSVGALAAGGSGKTPTAAWLARELGRRGAKVVIATRGYGRRGREPVCVVSDGRHLRADAEMAGDEALVLAGHAPGVPVLVGRDRGVVGLRAVSAFAADVLVLDDGFQHHRLARDLDLVLLDGGLGLGNGHVLPRGPLREPARALARADVLGVIEGPLPAVDEARVARLAPSARRFSAQRDPVALRPLAGGELAPAAELAGREVGILAGIANPESLAKSALALGARVVAKRSFPDHHRYRPRQLAGLAREAPLWVTTEKDAVKILPAWVQGADVRVLVIELAVEGAEELLAFVEARLR